MSTSVSPTRLVVARELREALRRKAVWVTAGVALLGATALMVLPELIGKSDVDRTVAVVGSPTPVFTNALMTTSNLVGLHAHIEPFGDQASASKAVRDDKVDIAVVVGDDPTVISKHSDDKMLPVVREALVIDRSTTRLQQDGLDDAQIADALAAPSPHIEIVDADRGGRVAAATVVSLGVYFLIFVVMAQVATGVAIEKSNRVSEVLLAIVPPRALLFGKVIGVGIIGVLPLLCGALPVVVKLIVGGSLPPGTGGVVAAGAAWFVLGAGFYLLVAGALGALVERQEEAGSTVASLSICLVLSYLIGQSAADSPLGAVLAYVPISSPMVEPARLALGVSSPAEVVISLILSVVGVVFAGRVASTIYRRAVVSTGRRLHLREVLRADKLATTGSGSH